MFWCAPTLPDATPVAHLCAAALHHRRAVAPGFIVALASVAYGAADGLPATLPLAAFERGLVRRARRRWVRQCLLALALAHALADIVFHAGLGVVLALVAGSLVQVARPRR